MTESEAYMAIVQGSLPNCEIMNYASPAKARKWYTVGIFTQEPPDSPAKSQGMIEEAKFKGFGDAWMYANYLARRPNSEWYWAVVVR